MRLTEIYVDIQATQTLVQGRRQDCVSLSANTDVQKMAAELVPRRVNSVALTANDGSLFNSRGTTLVQTNLVPLYLDEPPNIKGFYCSASVKL